MVEVPKTSYRWAAWTHWSNLAVLAAAGIAGATVDPSFWYALLPAQALVLWLAPDLPPLRKAVDAKNLRAQRDAERGYYLEQLWGLTPLPPPTAGERLKRLFVSGSTVDPDERLRHTPATAAYFEMRNIVAKLAEMIPLSNGRVKPQDIERFESVINAYLRILFACQPLERAVHETDEAQLTRDLGDVNNRLQHADSTLRPVLSERKRLLESQNARLPRLRASLELLRARAEALPHQLRNVQTQVLTDPGTEVHAMLDDMLERNDLLSDPLADLAADDAVRELLTGALDQAAGTAPAPKARPGRVGVRH
jgi:hypothetical protein